MNKFTLLYLILIASFISGCSKDWLDEKPNKALAIPTTIADFQAMLDNNSSTGNGNAVPFNSRIAGELGEISSGDFYVLSTTWNNNLSTLVEKYTYLWDKDIYQSADPGKTDWDYAYGRIYTANVILEGIQMVQAQPDEQAAWNNIKGSALFHRALDFFTLTQEFCKPYDKNTAKTDMGIPLRLESNFNIRSTRASLEDSYQQVLTDLLMAKDLLPAVPLVKTRPGKAAAFALLARVCIAMENYENAGIYADSTLNYHNILRKYKDANMTATAAAFPRYYDEVIFHYTTNGYGIGNTSRAIVDTGLIKLYTDNNDLRKAVFFRNVSGTTYTWRGGYHGVNGFFAGSLATDEVYLIRAEAHARQGNTALAMQFLNNLLRTRWKENTNGSTTYIDQVAANADEALAKVLLERRKQLCFRTTRWTDLRRLNKDSRFAVTLKRIVNNQTYLLSPNDPRYVLPIPESEILLSGIAQNPR